MTIKLDELDAAHAAATRELTEYEIRNGDGGDHVAWEDAITEAWPEVSRRLRALERVAEAARTVALGMVEKDQYGKESPICLGCRYPVDAALDGAT